MSRKSNVFSDFSQKKLYESSKRKRDENEEKIREYPTSFSTFLKRMFTEKYDEGQIQNICRDLLLYSDKNHYPPKFMIKYLVIYLEKKESENKQLVYSTLMELYHKYNPKEYSDMYYIPEALDFFQKFEETSQVSFTKFNFFECFIY